MPREMKTCGKCGKQKEAAEFYVSRLSVTGAPILMSRCKACILELRGRGKTRREAIAEKARGRLLCKIVRVEPALSLVTN